MPRRSSFSWPTPFLAIFAATWFGPLSYHENGHYRACLKKLHELSFLSALTPEAKLFKGAAISATDVEEGIHPMNEAIKEEPGFHLAWLMRAQARTSRGIDQNDEAQILLALKELASVGTYLGEEHPILSVARLYSRLAAYHVFRRKQEMDLATSYLDEAEVDVELLAGSPRFLYGNYDRMNYFDILSDFDAVGAVMEEAVKHGNGGFIVGPYARLSTEPGDSIRRLSS